MELMYQAHTHAPTYLEYVSEVIDAVVLISFPVFLSLPLHFARSVPD